MTFLIVNFILQVVNYDDGKVDSSVVVYLLCNRWFVGCIVKVSVPLETIMKFLALAEGLQHQKSRKPIMGYDLLLNIENLSQFI